MPARKIMNTSWSNYLLQIELAAQHAPASMLRLLMQDVAGTVEDLPDECAEYGRMLLLKLDHLLTQQQVLAAQANGAGPGYLAPNLVIPEKAARRRRRAA
ncbi:MAG TPA: hypothetical protein VH328_06300 [Burkholderiaceae bacterium]|nr:hypothetical protein [Burkholderiaceae bacterium]